MFHSFYSCPILLSPQDVTSGHWPDQPDGTSGALATSNVPSFCASCGTTLGVELWVPIGHSIPKLFEGIASVLSITPRA